VTAVLPRTLHDDWRRQAYCANSYDDKFFSDNDVDQAIVVSRCHTFCPVRVECLNYALEHNEKFGVWGGTTELERRQIETPRVRIKCPHCVGTRIFQEQSHAVCLTCGISWRTHV
jgi:WhiB family redox-sensing transcriptional regulator